MQKQSPYWLLSKDRHDEALVSLRKLRQGAFSESEIDEEFAIMAQSLDSTVEEGKFIELFQGTNLKRTTIVVLVNFFQQATGQAFASQYGALFVKSLDTINTFSMTVINGFIALSVLILCLFLTDKVGRR